jgi:acyl carrier protein
VSHREELLDLVRNNVLELDIELDDETSLVGSGLLDSMALYELMVFVAERIDPAVDLTEFDLRREWDTVAGVLAFIDAHRTPGVSQ